MQTNADSAIPTDCNASAVRKASVRFADAYGVRLHADTHSNADSAIPTDSHANAVRKTSVMFADAYGVRLHADTHSNAVGQASATPDAYVHKVYIPDEWVLQQFTDRHTGEQRQWCRNRRTGEQRPSHESKVLQPAWIGGTLDDNTSYYWRRSEPAGARVFLNELPPLEQHHTIVGQGHSFAPIADVAGDTQDIVKHFAGAIAAQTSISILRTGAICDDAEAHDTTEDSDASHFIADDHGNDDAYADNEGRDTSHSNAAGVPPTAVFPTATFARPSADGANTEAIHTVSITRLADKI